LPADKGIGGPGWMADWRVAPFVSDSTQYATTMAEIAHSRSSLSSWATLFIRQCTIQSMPDAHELFKGRGFSLETKIGFVKSRSSSGTIREEVGIQGPERVTLQIADHLQQKS